MNSEWQNLSSRESILKALNGLLMLTSSKYLEEAIAHKNTILDEYDDLVDELEITYKKAMILQQTITMEGKSDDV